MGTRRSHQTNSRCVFPKLKMVVLLLAIISDSSIWVFGPTANVPGKLLGYVSMERYFIEVGLTGDDCMYY